MGNCCSSASRASLLVDRRDCSLLSVESRTIDPFAPDPHLCSGPLLSFPLPRPDALAAIRPLSRSDRARVAACLREASPLWHGGNQLIFAAWCPLTITPTSSSSTSSKPARPPVEKVRVIVLSSTGRLLALTPKEVKRSVGVSRSEHVCALQRVLVDGDGRGDRGDEGRTEGGGLSLHFPNATWRITAPPPTSSALASGLWLLHALATAPHAAHATNLPPLPLRQLLPPPSADGNLHSSYCIWANKEGIEEPEEICLPPSTPSISPSSPGEVRFAIQMVREWLKLMEIDASSLLPSCLPPLASALAHNRSFVSLRVAHHPSLGPSLPSLAPVLSTNSTLLSLTLRDVGATPATLAILAHSLASNPISSLSVIDLSLNHAGEEGGKALAAALAALRGGVLAELRLTDCRIGNEGMGAVLRAMGKQRNLLQLEVSGNDLGGAKKYPLISHLSFLTTHLSSLISPLSPLHSPCSFLTTAALSPLPSIFPCALHRVPYTLYLSRRPLLQSAHHIDPPTHCTPLTSPLTHTHPLPTCSPSPPHLYL